MSHQGGQAGGQSAALLDKAQMLMLKPTPNGRPVVDVDRQNISGHRILEMHDGDLPLELGNRDRQGNDLRTLLSDPAPGLHKLEAGVQLSFMQVASGILACARMTAGDVAN